MSVTDGCVGWEETEAILEELTGAVKARRNAAAEPKEVAPVAEALSNTVVGAMQTSHTRRSSFHQLIEKFRPPITSMEISL